MRQTTYGIFNAMSKLTETLARLTNEAISLVLDPDYVNALLLKAQRRRMKHGGFAKEVVAAEAGLHRSRRLLLLHPQLRPPVVGSSIPAHS